MCFFLSLAKCIFQFPRISNRDLSFQHLLWNYVNICILWFSCNCSNWLDSKTMHVYWMNHYFHACWSTCGCLSNKLINLSEFWFNSSTNFLFTLLFEYGIGHFPCMPVDSCSKIHGKLEIILVIWNAFDISYDVVCENLLNFYTRLLNHSVTSMLLTRVKRQRSSSYHHMMDFFLAEILLNHQLWIYWY